MVICDCTIKLLAEIPIAIHNTKSPYCNISCLQLLCMAVVSCSIAVLCPYVRVPVCVCVCSCLI